MPFQSAYAASKHGVVGFLDSLRIELSREGVAVSVTNIMPSGMNTPLFQKALTRLGVEPRPPPPVYAPELVSRAILHAACTPRRDLVVGGAGWALQLAHRLSPAITDAILRSPAGYDSQLTDRPKSPQARSNLFEPSLDTLARVEGIFGAETLRKSLFTRLELGRGAVLLQRAASAVASVAARAFEAGWRLGLPKAARSTPQLGNRNVRH